MKQSFLTEIQQKKLCDSKDNILLAVSGGIDSMVMFNLFQECGFKIGVAHANFQLRGDESDGDEKFVKEICEKNSIPFFTKRFETDHFANENHLSIQMAARALRYQWFDEVLTEQKYDIIATAHHLNDAIETVLLNMVRGSGLEGLDGIASKNKKIIRPMLFATREQIANYAIENKIQWREDRSNSTDDYSRNFIRHQVYPLLKELNPSLEKTFQENIGKISGAVELMEIGIEQWKEKFEKRKENQILLDKKGFMFKNPESVLWNLIKSCGFNLDQCRQIITAIDGQSGKLFTSSQFELVIDRDLLIISRIQDELKETLIHVDQTEATLGNFRMKLEKKQHVDIKDNSSLAFLDASKLTFPLRWRKWKPGDSFHPLGMTHKKKLSDFLIDQKISMTDKEMVTVLESGNEIIWVVGLRIDERYKINESTVTIVHCHLSTTD